MGTALKENTENLREVPSTRNGIMDVFRSFGILLMIMGHIGYGSIFDYLIHGFHMPMFFWISGYFFKHKSKEEQSFSAFVLKKAKSLLLPYFIFGTAHFVLVAGISYIKSRTVDFSPLLHLLSDNTEGLPICGALWFLTALFFAEILFFLIDRYITGEIRKAIIVFAIALFGNISKKILPFSLPFALCQGFVGLGFLFIGYQFRNNCKQKIIERLMNLSWLPTCVLGVLTILLIFLNGYVNMRTGTYAMIPLFWINVVLAIIVGYNLSKLIYPIIKNNFLGKYLVSVGRNSIVYVCLNQIAISFVSNGFKLIGLDFSNASILTFLFQTVILFATLFILWISDMLISNTKLKIIIGK